MRKTINISALVFFIWLVVSALSIPDQLINFLLVGAVPGTSIVLSPSMMLAILTALVLVVVLGRFNAFRRTRKQLTDFISQEDQPPRRRLGNA